MPFKNKNKLDIYAQEIIEKYKNGMSCRAIGREYNCDKKTVKKLLSENNVELTRTCHVPYSFNENFFENIDTPDKAYVFGLWCADGCIVAPHAIKITLQEDDRELLEKVRKIMDIEKPLVFTERSKKNPKWKNTYGIVLYSDKMFSDLKKMGCTERKSLTLEFPSFLSEELMSHFIRGYFDGDGSVSKKRRGCGSSIVSSTIFCEKLYDYLTNKLNIECHWVKVKENPKTSKICIYKKVETKKLMDFMYKDADLYMERKYRIFKEKFPEASDINLIMLVSKFVAMSSLS